MDLHIRAVWPGRRIPSQEALQVVRENPDALDGAGRGQAPQSFEVRLVRDAGARFAGAKTFIDELVGRAWSRHFNSVLASCDTPGRISYRPFSHCP